MEILTLGVLWLLFTLAVPVMWVQEHMALVITLVILWIAKKILKLCFF